MASTIRSSYDGVFLPAKDVSSIHMDVRVGKESWGPSWDSILTHFLIDREKRAERAQFLLSPSFPSSSQTQLFLFDMSHLTLSLRGNLIGYTKSFGSFTLSFLLRLTLSLHLISSSLVARLFFFFFLLHVSHHSSSHPHHSTLIFPSQSLSSSSTTFNILYLSLTFTLHMRYKLKSEIWLGPTLHVTCPFSSIYLPMLKKNLTSSMQREFQEVKTQVMTY